MRLTDFVGSVSASGTVTVFDPVGVHALLLIGSTLYAAGEFNQAQSGLTLATRLRGAAFNVANSQIQAWNPSTNRLINGLARDSDGSDLFIGGRFSRVNVDPNDPFNTGQLRNAVAKVDEAARHGESQLGRPASALHRPHDADGVRLAGLPRGHRSRRPR